MPLNLVHVTVVHGRYDIRILFKQCASLQSAGLGSVSLFVADGLGDELWKGVRIHDVGRPSLGRAGRAIAGNFRMWRALRKARPDLVHLHDPELLPLGLWLRRAGTRVVFDMHENLPKEVMTKNWVAPGLRRSLSSLVQVIQSAALKRMSVVFAETSYSTDFSSAARSEVVLNYPLVDSLTAITRDKRPCFTVGYIGGLSEERGTPVVVQAIAKLRAKGLDAHGVLIGRTAPEPLLRELLNKGQAEGWLNAPGQLSPGNGWPLIAECHVGVAILKPSLNFVESYPTKLFEYMALGLPVVVSDFPLWRRVVDECRCGLVVDPDDVDAVVKALEWIAEHPHEATAMGKAGKSTVAAQYRWETEFRKLKDFYLVELATAARGPTV